ATIDPLPARPPPPAPPLEPLPEAPRRLEISAGPAAWLGTPSDARAGALLSATVRLAAPWEMSLLAMGAASSSTAWLVGGQQRGNVTVRQAAVALSGAACTEPSGVRLCGGPMAGVRASVGSADGAVRQAGSATLWEAELGLHARAGLDLGSRLRLGLQIVAAAPLGSGSFAVAG